jgi:hypothetical protein
VSGIDLQIPKFIERYMASLAQIYGRQGKRTLEAIVVNAQFRVDPNWRQGWENKTYYGQALYLAVPSALFVTQAKQRDELRNQIRDELNTLHGLKQEWFDEVFLELAVDQDDDWRKKSGALIGTTRAVNDRAAKRIWGDGSFRVFLSHKTEVRVQSSRLKGSLEEYGISSFVAHKDINPSIEWQNEIENALASMDAFVAILTEKFHDSRWTDQEVGYALARGVPIIAIKLGLDPYGFIGKFQALTTTWEEAPLEIVKLLINHDRMMSAYIGAMRKCDELNSANQLAEVLPEIESMTQRQIDEMIDTYNDNGIVNSAFGFNGRREAKYGPGLIHYLNRFSKYQFEYDEKRKITIPF